MKKPNSKTNNSSLKESLRMFKNNLSDEFNSKTHEVNSIKSKLLNRLKKSEPVTTLTKDQIKEKYEEILNKNLLLIDSYSFKDIAPLVSIIILNRNGLEHLKRLFNNFEKNSQYPNYEIIVVDNASTDNSINFLEEIKDNIPLKIIKNTENKSFSIANNQAAHTAKGEYLLLLNNDIEPTYGWLSQMMHVALKSGEIGAVGAKLVYPYSADSIYNKNNSFQIQHSGIAFKEESGYVKPYNIQNKNLFGSEDEFETERAALTAAALLLRKDKYWQVGGLDEDYDYGYEDVDLCLKLLKKGYKNIYCPKALLFHYEFGTQETNRNKEIKNRRLNNRKIFCQKWNRWLLKKLFLDKLNNKYLFSEHPLKIAFIVTESGNNVSAGDYFTALELGEGLKTLGWDLKFISRKGSEDWYDVEEDIDVLISLLDSYDPRKIRSPKKSLIKIAWARNWFERWVSNPGFSDYDIVFASSKTACNYVQQESGIETLLMPIATNSARFHPNISPSPDYLSDYCFTGSYWNDPREIIEMLDPKSLPYSFKLYGENWDKIEKFKEYSQGFVDYSKMPTIYASTKIVIDDANRVTKSYGAVNSRVYDALASGALVLTNGEIGAKETFEGKLPVFKSKEELNNLIDYYLTNEDARLSKVKELQKFVLENHTYVNRGNSLKEVLEQYFFRKKIVKNQSICYKIEYLNFTDHSFIQKLISKFPSIYILKKNKVDIKRGLIHIKGYKAIKKNNLIDIGYYLENNPDVRRSGVDPLMHYICNGYKEGRNPNPTFDGNYYLQTYSDVKKSNMNPLVHYVLYGMNDGRKTIRKTQLMTKLSEEKRKKLENEHKVSIIMPTYNRANIIKRAIDSILNQTFDNYEIIIIDDGSNDKTECLINEYYDTYLKKGIIRYFKQKNKGVSAARNNGLSKANGSIIAYLDSDNCWFETYLERMVYALDESNSNTAYSVIQINNGFTNQKYLRDVQYNRNQILKGNFIDLNIFVHKKFLYQQLGGFNESLKRLVDWDLILRYTRLNKPYFVNEILAKYYLNNALNNISHTINLEENLLKIQKLHINEAIEKGIDKLRIGYFLWKFPTSAQTSLINEIKWLVKNNFDIIIFYKERGNEEKLDLEIESFQIEAEKDLIKKISEFNINMMHTPFEYESCAILTHTAEKTGVFFTVNTKKIDFSQKENEMQMIIKAFNSQYCKRIFVSGPSHYDYLKDKGIRSEKLTFLEQKSQHEIDISSSRFKREFKKVMTITSFMGEEEANSIIETAKILKQKKLILKVYGSGPLEEYLVDQIKKLKLKNVFIYSPIRSKESLIHAFQEADLFIVHPMIIKNENENFYSGSVFIFEAMEYGIPIIYTKIPLAKDLAYNDCFKLVDKKNQPFSLSKKIEYYMTLNKKDLFTALKYAQNKIQKASVNKPIETMLDTWISHKFDIFIITFQKNQNMRLENIQKLIDILFKHTNVEFDLTIITHKNQSNLNEFLLKYSEQHSNIRLIFLNKKVPYNSAYNFVLKSVNNKFIINMNCPALSMLDIGWEQKALNYMKEYSSARNNNDNFIFWI
ncbi:MAG: glycosyltransferase [Methanobacteriaceae archaeon]|nr:glycosyltransferase [Methanobacteriaceae archaeon]MDP2835962.1 glycosyltransferase [Methanobacteriaceae archaeon]MDP3035828.1 glycosyltransferase [Methanobacteriaceae archaeon]MDP3484547.1 glycosyltransferase [Methanobacteriaceae archaeon]MDP3622961.1 glycosyltransferase [Methanobacteriaceae archaeon]